MQVIYIKRFLNIKILTNAQRVVCPLAVAVLQVTVLTPEVVTNVQTCHVLKTMSPKVDVNTDAD